MTPDGSARYRDVAEAAWRWVRTQVEWSDGPRIPTSVDVDRGTVLSTEDDYRDGMQEGSAGWPTCWRRSA